MRQFSFLFAVVCLSLLGWADAQAQSLGYWANPDSLLAVDRDTVNAQLNIGSVGDCISGYDVTVEPVYPDGTTGVSHPQAFRWYHIDKLGNKVAQIVVLQEQWHNLPPDLALWHEDTANGQRLTGKAGFKVAALTPKELAEARYHHEVWGEVWEACYPKGITNANRDTMPNYPGYEIICYCDSVDLNQIPKYGPAHRSYSRELMTYTDSATMTNYLCVAPNWGTGGADYTPGVTGGKYNTRWIVPSKKETDYWWNKYLKFIKKQDGLKHVKEL